MSVNMLHLWYSILNIDPYNETRTFQKYYKNVNPHNTAVEQMSKIEMPWVSVSVGWSIVLYTKRLQVWSPVGVHTEGNLLMFLMFLT